VALSIGPRSGTAQDSPQRFPVDMELIGNGDSMRCSIGKMDLRAKRLITGRGAAIKKLRNGGDKLCRGKRLVQK